MDRLWLTLGIKKADGQVVTLSPWTPVAWVQLPVRALPQLTHSSIPLGSDNQVPALLGKNGESYDAVGHVSRTAFGLIGLRSSPVQSATGMSFSQLALAANAQIFFLFLQRSD